MDVERATDELYGLTPTAFTAARNAKVAEARKAGAAEVAASLKELRKPSVGAWLANLLVRERSKEIDDLIALGDSLRAPKSKLGGHEIRKVSKDKVDATTKLVRHAKVRASQLDHPASASAVEDLEMSLEAAFADPRAAASLRQGRLTSGLRYSGLGFAAQPDTRSPSRAEDSGRGPGAVSEAKRIAAQRNVDRATHEAEAADAQAKKASQAVKQASQAVKKASAELSRLQVAEELAARRAKEAHARASAAKKKLPAG